MISGKIKAHFGVEVLVQTSSGSLLRVKIGRNSGHVVGDNVQIIQDHLKRLERQNELKRKTPFGNQVLAANLTHVGIVVSLTPKTPPFFIDQVIIACRAEHIEPFIIVSKLDLPGGADFLEEIGSRYSSSVKIFSPFEKERLGGFSRLIFVGVSGAGKSTLINQLVPDANQEIGDLSDHQSQGKHTTSGSILLDLPGGGELIDSPGVRDFTPVDLSADQIAYYFPGFEKFADTPCKFRNCLHQTEPGCVVREQADPKCYEQYLAICASNLSAVPE